MRPTVRIFLASLALISLNVRHVASAPAPQDDDKDTPIPYNYEYQVEDQEKLVFYGANEKGDGTGNVEGSYQVLLPDKRLMKVVYTVNGDSGFVPVITFEDNANPFTA